MAQYAQYLAVQNMYAAGLQETFVQEQLKLAMTTAGRAQDSVFFWE